MTTPPVTDLSPHGPPDRLVSIDISWTELLRTPDGQLRRLLADRYRRAAHTGRTLDAVISELAAKGIRAEARRHQVNAMLDAEVARLDAAARAIYVQKAHDFTARIQAGERVHRTTEAQGAAA